ncbi:MAG: sulfurtransferase TusA family protein [Myxococcales bacterium]|nr:sulfurtransferase TusA family protein [Myxococcales bacterium]HRC55926.1 sulfurtransferase TusA family protein [Kofleriaceae bacterium]
MHDPEPVDIAARAWRDGDPLLDLRGEVCPFTFVRAKVLLEELELGACLRLVVDHPPAAANVPRSLREWGQRVLDVQPATAGTWQIDVQKLCD